MASNVRIVFANGSVAMANNTNDTRERWELRHEISAQTIRQESKAGYAIPLVDSFSGIEELVSYKQILLEVLAATKLRKAYSAKNVQISGDIKIQLESVLKQVGKQIALVDELISDRRKTHAIKLRQLGETRSAEDSAQALRVYARNLEGILIDNDIPLPAPPFEGWHKRKNA